MGLFVNEDGVITASGFFIVIGIPILLTGRWTIGLTFILMGFIGALSKVMDDIQQEDKLENRLKRMSAAEIQKELTPDDRQKCIVALGVLAKKCARSKKKKSSQYKPHEMELLCQESAYTVLNFYSDKDDAVASALSLHALVAKDEQVRERHLHQADKFGLNIPINAMEKSLKRAQENQNPTEEWERMSAELQRKGCLLLGALADGDVNMATKLVDEGGLEAILNALSWYRFHEDVANWGLWAIFNLCYEHSGNKAQLVRLGGIQAVCLSLKNVSDSLEVTRHGIAILFDLLREIPESPTDVATIRKIALSAGLHDVLRTAMDEFSESMEVMMMAQEILIATGYTGEIPHYQPMQ